MRTSTSILKTARLPVLLAAVLIAGCSEDAPKPVQVEQLQQTEVVKPPPPPPEELKPVLDDSAMVVALEGKVEIRRGDQPSWDEAKVGDKVAANDSVRTAESSNVELTVGEARLSVKEHSDVKVKSVGKGKLRARVNGHMEADVKAGSGATVEMEADGSDTVLTTKGGKVAMMADGQGIVSVASTEGVASLRVGDKDSELKAGEAAHVVDDKMERDTLTELLFAVNWPGNETNKGTVPIEGKAPVGSRVIVQGKVVKVDKRGRFQARVALVDGKQKLAVVVKDVSGRVREQTHEINLDKRNKLDVGKVRWGK